MGLVVLSLNDLTLSEIYIRMTCHKICITSFDITLVISMYSVFTCNVSKAYCICVVLILWWMLTCGSHTVVDVDV